MPVIQKSVVSGPQQGGAPTSSDGVRLKPKTPSGGLMVPALTACEPQNEGGNSNTLRMSAWRLEDDYTIDQIQWNLAVVAATQGATFDLVLYGSVDGIPDGAPLWESKGIDADGPIGIYTENVNLSLSKGLYFFGFRRESGAANVLRGVAQEGLINLSVVVNGAVWDMGAVWETPSTAGSAFPTFDETLWASGTYASDNMPFFAMRVA